MNIFSQINIDEGQLNVPKTATPGDSTVSDLLSYTFAILAAIAIIVIVVAGMRFVLSQGNTEKANNARNTIIYAAVGLALAAGAFAIVRIVVGEI